MGAILPIDASQRRRQRAGVVTEDRRAIRQLRRGQKHTAMIVAMLRQAGSSPSLCGFDDFRTGFVVWLTRIGNKCCDSVFGPMAFFPIVIRKVERYVAMHKRKKSAARRTSGARKRVRGWGRAFRCDGSARGHLSVARFARQARDGWQRRLRRHADAISNRCRAQSARTLIEIKNGFDLTS